MAKNKKAVQEAQAKIDAQNRVFWLYEFIQRAENGGHPVPNETNLGHGEPVYVVKKRELMKFMAGIRPMIIDYVESQFTQTPAPAQEALDTIDRVLAENQFVAPLRQLGTPKTDG